MTEENQTIPIERLNKEIEKRRAAEAKGAEFAAQLEALRAEAQTWQAKADKGAEVAAQLAAVQAQAEKQTQRHGSIVSLLESGINDPSVRDFVLHRFDQQAAAADGQEWGAWWDSQRTDPSAVLRPFLQDPERHREQAHAPKQGGPAEAPQSAPEAPQPATPPTPAPVANGGARPSPTPGRWSGADFARMASSNPSAFIDRLRSGEFNN